MRLQFWFAVMDLTAHGYYRRWPLFGRVYLFALERAVTITWAGEVLPEDDGAGFWLEEVVA